MTGRKTIDAVGRRVWNGGVEGDDGGLPVYLRGCVHLAGSLPKPCDFSCRWQSRD